MLTWSNRRTCTSTCPSTTWSWWRRWRRTRPASGRGWRSGSRPSPSPSTPATMHSITRSHKRMAAALRGIRKNRCRWRSCPCRPLVMYRKQWNYFLSMGERKPCYNKQKSSAYTPCWIVASLLKIQTRTKSRRRRRSRWWIFQRRQPTTSKSRKCDLLIYCSFKLMEGAAGKK